MNETISSTYFMFAFSLDFSETVLVLCWIDDYCLAIQIFWLPCLHALDQ